MKENKDCKIVQDLLPNYIEDLTSEETNLFIEEHLRTCESCQEMLDSMKQDIKMETVQQDDREVEYIKKFNVKFKKAEYKFFVLIYTIIAILIVGVLAFFGRRYYILNDLANKASKYMNATNFYMKFNNLHGEGFVTNEIWVKDGKSRSKSSTVASFGTVSQHITNEEGLYIYFADDEEPRFYEGEKDYSLDYLKNSIEFIQEDFTEIKSIFTHSIETIKLNNKICYKISSAGNKGQYRYFEKETGLPIKQETWEVGDLSGETEVRCSVSNYEFKFDCVKNKDLEYDNGKDKVYEEVKTEANLEETATLTDDDLKIEVGNISYDKENNHFDIDFKFSTLDDKAFEGELEYEYIISDASDNVVASSVPIIWSYEKDKIMKRFDEKYPPKEEVFGGLAYRMIGVADKIVNSEEAGIVDHTYSVPDLSEEVNTENLIVWITSVKYKIAGEEEETELYKDFIFNLK